MPVPGSNILNTAMRAIAKQSFTYYAFLSRTPNQIGQDVTKYDSPMTMQGSVQPVPRTLYQAYGLDFQRYYLNFYVSKSVLDVSRDISGDQIAFNGRRFQCMSKTDWFGQDGWVAVLAIEVLVKESEC
jgi:hypothetical protein